MASKNAQYQRMFRERLGDAGRSALARLKAVKRILAGGIPQASTLEKYGIDNQEVNRIRASGGLAPIDLSLRPTHCRRGEGTCPRVDPPPGGRIILPTEPQAPVPTPGRRPRTRGRTLDLDPAPTNTVVRRRGRRSIIPDDAPPAQPAPTPSRGLTLAEVLEKIEGLRGSVQLTPSGRPAMDKNGRPKTLGTARFLRCGAA